MYLLICLRFHCSPIKGPFCEKIAYLQVPYHIKTFLLALSMLNHQAQHENLNVKQRMKLLKRPARESDMCLTNTGGLPKRALLYCPLFFAFLFSQQRKPQQKMKMPSQYIFCIYIFVMLFNNVTGDGFELCCHSNIPAIM